MDAQLEEWRDIPFYKGLYQISNLGRVRKIKTGRIIKGSKVAWHVLVTLFDKSLRKTFLLHRLVAIAFVPNPENFKYIVHLDSNPYNNKASNLVWQEVLPKAHRSNKCVQGQSYRESRKQKLNSLQEEGNKL